MEISDNGIKGLGNGRDKRVAWARLVRLTGVLMDLCRENGFKLYMVTGASSLKKVGVALYASHLGELAHILLKCDEKKSGRLAQMAMVEACAAMVMCNDEAARIFGHCLQCLAESMKDRSRTVEEEVDNLLDAIRGYAHEPLPEQGAHGNRGARFEMEEPVSDAKTGNEGASSDEGIFRRGRNNGGTGDGKGSAGDVWQGLNMDNRPAAGMNKPGRDEIGFETSGLGDLLRQLCNN